MRTVLYVDGFNLYYRMLRSRPDCKWLDLVALARLLLPAPHDVTRVNYYTARLSARAHDPQAPARQAVYLRALRSKPEMVIHEGAFLTSEPWMPLARPVRAKPDGYVWNEPVPEVVKVRKSEEKGSDVNLAAHLVRDAFTDAFDVAAVITNDTNLVEPIRIAVHEAGKRVGLIIPVASPAASLTAVASFHLHLRPGHLTRSQFPDEVTDGGGNAVRRPAIWV